MYVQLYACVNLSDITSHHALRMLHDFSPVGLHCFQELEWLQGLQQWCLDGGTGSRGSN